MAGAKKRVKSGKRVQEATRALGQGETRKSRLSRKATRESREGKSSVVDIGRNNNCMQKEAWISTLRKELLHASVVAPESVHTERRLSIPTVESGSYAVSLPTSTSLSIPDTSMADLSALNDPAAEALPIDAGDHEGQQRKRQRQ
jgi:hypothetical protein